MTFRKLGIFLVKRVLPVLLATLLVSCLLFFLFFDSLAQTALEKSRRNLPGQVTVGRFSPTFGGVKLTEVRLDQSAQEPVFEASEIVLDLNWSELWDRNWSDVVETATLSRPGLRVVVDPQGQVNLITLLAPKPDVEPIDLSTVRTRVVLDDGWILYKDQRDADFLYELGDCRAEFGLSDGENLEFSVAATPNWSVDKALEKREGGDIPSQLKAEGTLSLLKPSIECDLKFKELELDAFAGFPGFGPGLTLVEGQLNGSARASGEGETWNDVLAGLFLVGSFQLSDGTYRAPWMPAALEEMNGQIDLLGSEVSTENFNAATLQIPMVASGRGELGAGGRVEASVKTPRFGLEKLNALLAVPFPVEGQAEAEINLAGTLNSTILSGQVKGFDIKAKGQNVSFARSDFLKTEDFIHLSDMMAETQAGNVSGEGWLFLGQEPRILFDLKGRDTDPELLLPGFARNANFEVTLMGEPSAPVVYGQGTLFGLGSWAQGMQKASGRFLMSEDDLLLYNGLGSIGNSLVELKVGAFDLARRHFMGVVSAQDFDARDVPGLSGLSGTFTGDAFVDADLSGETPKLSAVAKMTKGDLSSGGVAVKNATGEALFDGDRVVIPEAQATYLGSVLNMTGTYDLRNQGVSAQLQGKGLDLAPLGIAQRADLRASVNGHLDGKLGVYAVADSAQGKLALSGYQNENGQVRGVGWVEASQGEIEVESTIVAEGTRQNLSLEYNGQVAGLALEEVGPVQLAGEAQLQGDHLSIRPTLLSAREAPSDSRLYPLTTYSGAAYSFFGPLMAGPLKKVVIEESPFPKARSLVVAGGADLGGGTLDLDFQMRAAGLEELPLPMVAQKFPFHLLSGFGSLDGKILGSLANPRIEANFLFPWLMLGDALDQRQALGASGHLSLDSERLTVDEMALSPASFDSRLSKKRTEVGSDGLLRLSGFLDQDESFDVRARTNGFSPHFFAFFLSPTLRPWVPSGKLVTDSLHLWGTLEEPSIAGDLSLKDGGLMMAGSPFPINSVFLDFSSQSGEVKVSELSFLAPGIDISGSALRRKSGKLQGSLFANDIDLSKLHRFGGLWSGFEGEADVHLGLAGNFPSSPQLELGFKTRGLSFNPRVIGGRDQTVAIESLRLGSFEGEKMLEGLTLASSNRGYFFEFPESGFFFRRSMDGLGLMASGAISVPASPQRAFTTFGEIAEYFASPQGPDFGKGKNPFKLEIKNLSTAEASLLTGRETKGAEVSTSLELSLLGQWWRDHQKEAGDDLPHYHLGLRSLQLEGGLEGSRSGMKLDTQASADYQRDGEVGFLSLKDWQFGFFREQKPLEGEEETVDEEDKILRQGVIDAAGRFAIATLPGVEASSEFNLGAADIPLANLSFLLPEYLPLSGLVESLEINLNGTLPSPKLSVAGLVSDLTLGPLSNMRMEGAVLASLQDDVYRIVIGEQENPGVKVTFGENDPEGHSVTVGGEADLKWINDPNPEPDRLALFAKNLSLSLDSPLRLSANAIDRNLEVLSDLVPGEVNSEGTFEGYLLTEGTIRRPEFVGSATLENGRFDSKLYGRFEKLQLDAKINRIQKADAVDTAALESASSGFLTRLDLNKIEGFLGGQPFFGGGVAEFAGVVPTFLDLFFVGESLPIKFPGLFVGKADIDLEVNGEIARNDSGAYIQPRLDGLIVVPSGEFSLPLNSGAASTASSDSGVRAPIDVALDISLGKGFFVRALDSQVRAVGELKLLAKDGWAKVYGQTALSRGSVNIPFYDASFRIRQGVAHFDGPFIPRLEAVEAVADLGSYRVTARADGRYPDTFKLSLFSDPPLPQAQLSRLAVTSGLPSQLTGTGDPSQNTGTLGSLSDTGVSFLSGILTNRLTEKLGNLLFLSELSFDYIPPATYAIKAAKALDSSDSFLLTVTRIIRESGLSENLFGVEWRFSRAFLVRLAFDQLARARFWVQSINRF